VPKLKICILFLLVLLLVVGSLKQKHALACEFVAMTDFKKISSNIFVSPEFSIDKHHELIMIIKSGKNRIKNTFGLMRANPIIVVTKSNDEASFFGSNLAGTTHLSPVGECVVLGPNGINVNVVSHEFAHVELHNRVGWLKYALNIPIWFSEGIALLVDYREPFLLENISISEVKVEAVKNKGVDFFTDGNTHENYLASRVAIEYINASSLYEKLDEIHKGRNFNDVFSK
jgi:hypothetical protein